MRWSFLAVIVYLTSDQTSSSVEAENLEYDSPDNFHTVKAEIRDEDGSNISVKFYLDGALITIQYGSNDINELLCL